MNVQKTWAMVASVVAFSLSMMFAPGQLVANDVSDAKIDKVGVEIFGKDYNSVIAISKEDFDEKYGMSREEFSETYRSKTSNAERKEYKINLKKKFKMERAEAAKIYKVGVAIFGQDFLKDDSETFVSKYELSQDDVRSEYGNSSAEEKKKLKKYFTYQVMKYNLKAKIASLGREFDWIDALGFIVYKGEYIDTNTMKSFREKYLDDLNMIGEEKVGVAFMEKVGKDFPNDDGDRVFTLSENELRAIIKSLKEE